MAARATPAICIGCACDERHACEDAFGDPCGWIALDERAQIGICSSCWPASDRTEANRNRRTQLRRLYRRLSALLRRPQ